MILQRPILAWLRWRYGGNVYGLMPPLGYNTRYERVSLARKVAYGIKKVIWLAESALFKRYGQPMRDAWKKGCQS